MASSAEYTPLPVDEDKGTTNEYPRSRVVTLAASDRRRLVKSMILKYMLPLCEWLLVRLRTGLITLASHQVCVYLVGERFRGFFSIYSPIHSLV